MRCQQDELYRSEDPVTAGELFTSLDQLETWLHAKLLDTWWWHERFPKVRGIKVPRVDRVGDGSVGAWFSDDGIGVIEMSPAHWCAKFVCHEVAHVTAAAEGSTAHDPIFARHYLEILYRALGHDTWIELRQAFIDAEIVF